MVLGGKAQKGYFQQRKGYLVKLLGREKREVRIRKFVANIGSIINFKK